MPIRHTLRRPSYLSYRDTYSLPKRLPLQCQPAGKQRRAIFLSIRANWVSERCLSPVLLQDAISRKIEKRSCIAREVALLEIRPEEIYTRSAVAIFQGNGSADNHPALFDIVVRLLAEFSRSQGAVLARMVDGSVVWRRQMLSQERAPWMTYVDDSSGSADIFA